MYGDRDQLRSFVAASWRKHLQRQPLTPLETLIADIVAMHPEYQPQLQSGHTLELDWPAGDDGVNPFLHLSLHLAVAEQLQSGQPAGLADQLQRLTRHTGDRHAALHLLMHALEQCLWQAQRDGRVPDLETYWQTVLRLP